MIARVRAFIPIRSFDGMSRLATALGPDDRRALGIRLARQTILSARQAGTTATVITNDPVVRRWADDLGVSWLAEPVPGSLDAAAGAGISTAGGDPWLVVHADLPALGPDDIRLASSMTRRGTVLAPSHDGGTSLVGGMQPTFPFRYGPGSFRRHLAALKGHATVLVRPGLAFDLDRPRDLHAYRRLGCLVATSHNTPDSTGGNGR